MRNDETQRLDLASAVADGRTVDWASTEAAMSGEEERHWARNLRLIAELSAVHRSQEDVSLDADWNTNTLRRPDGLEDTFQPAVWGGMKVLDLVGEGTCGRVFRARDQKLGREVALKLFPSAADVNDVVAEARLLARVRHPNMIVVHGADRHEGRAGIWMEFIAGRALESIVAAQGPLGAREAAGIGMDLCRALAAVHGAGLVHGDVKANNVMREEGGRIVLMDLSSARDTRASGTGAGLSGTPLYMAPELFTGATLSPAVDIYSLGVLLYYLVTGSFPVNGTSLSELKAAHSRGERRLLRDVRPDLPEPFVRLVERALESDPTRRFETVGRMEAALAGYAGEGAPTTPAVGGTRPSRSPFRWALPLAAVVVAAIGFQLLRSGGGSPAPEDRRGAGPAQTAEGLATTVPMQLETPSRTGKPLEAQLPTGASDRSAGALTAPNHQQILTPSRALPGSPAYIVEASFYRNEGGVNLPLAAGARVSPGDRLSLEFKASRKLHLYVLNEDERGSAFLLFPLAGQSLVNPLSADQLHQLPGAEDSWQVTSEGGREHFLLIASPTPLADVEAAIAALPAAERGRPVAMSGGVLDQLRGLGGVVRAPSGPATEASRLRDIMRLIAARPETVHGAWIRSFDLVS